MPVIDADTHVIESEQTWDYLEGDDRALRPVALITDNDYRGERKLWMLDAHFFARAGGERKIPLPIRDMSDLATRIRIMDEMGVDVQVLYPTMMQAAVSDKPDVQVPLCRAYNRWLADICKEGKGRFRWVLVPPLGSMTDALAELDFGKKHGACGIFLRGMEGDRTIHHSYFFPLYEKAQELDLPVCIHAGNGSVKMRDMTFGDNVTVIGDAFYTGTGPVLAAFNAFITHGITVRFPRLRSAFVEAGAQWVPYTVKQALRFHRLLDMHGPGDEFTAVRDHRLWITVNTDDDIPYVMRWAGEGNLLIGTDYGHRDAGAEVDAIDMLRRRPDMDTTQVKRILEDNPAALYGLN